MRIKIIFSLLVCFGGTYSFGQKIDSVWKYTSPVWREWYKARGEDTMRQRVDFTRHIILFETYKKVISIYGKDLEYTLDVLNPLSTVNRKTTSIYRYACLDSKQNRQVEVSIYLLNDENFMFQLNFGATRNEYMLDK